nr:ATP-binding protein [Lysinibacillus timonensis]
MKRNKLKLIIILSFILFLLFISINVYSSYVKIESTVEASIANQSVEMAESIAASIDTDTYKQFLQDPVENEHYWEIRDYLNDAREKIGALYVYTLKIDNPKVSTALIMGLPEDDPLDYAIGTPCTVPEEQVKRAYEGKTYVTSIIKDELLGLNYISVGAPIKDDVGNIIGYLGIDISVEQLNAIEGKVIESSISVLLFNGLFVLIVIITVVLMQNWYQKETKKEVEDTEDTYHAEIKALLASVSSIRHDFANHVQVLHGLLLIGKSEQALEYLSSMSKEIHSIKSINVNIKHPGLMVLIQTKKLSAQNQHIDMEVSVSDDPFSHMKTTDLIRLLSNLIDNAIDATIELPETEREITIDCQTNGNQYEFLISNTGPKITDMDKIFKQGFSTKKDVQGKLRGQGLFIVKNIVTKYNGKITIDSSEAETTVFVEIPIKKS